MASRTGGRLLRYHTAPLMAVPPSPAGTGGAACLASHPAQGLLSDKSASTATSILISVSSPRSRSQTCLGHAGPSRPGPGTPEVAGDPQAVGVRVWPPLQALLFLITRATVPAVRTGQALAMDRVEAGLVLWWLRGTCGDITYRLI